MKFCTQCQNMYYISASGNDLTYYCRSCGFKDSELTDAGVTVLKTQFKASTSSVGHMVNRYMKYDPTLPRKKNMVCPNATCAITHDESDIIYMRYDDDNMKYLYICAKCDTSWKTDDKK